MLKDKCYGRQTSLMLFKREENIFFVSAITFMQFALGVSPLRKEKHIVRVMNEVFQFRTFTDERVATFNLTDLDDILKKVKTEMEDCNLCVDADSQWLENHDTNNYYENENDDFGVERNQENLSKAVIKEYYFGRLKQDDLLELSRHSRFVTIACFEKDGELSISKTDFLFFINKEASFSVDLKKEILRAIGDKGEDGSDDSIKVENLHACLKDIVRNILKGQPHKIRQRPREQIRLFREKARRLDEHWCNLASLFASSQANNPEQICDEGVISEGRGDQILICLPLRRTTMMVNRFWRDKELTLQRCRIKISISGVQILPKASMATNVVGSIVGFTTKLYLGTRRLHLL